MAASGVERDVTRRRLIVHCMLPGGADDALAARFFNPLVPPLERIRLRDPMHEGLRRWPEALGPPAPGVRLAAGRVPIGYFDLVAGPVTHVCTLSDPVAGFLRFAERLAALPAETALRYSGLGPAELSGADPEARALRLIAQPRVRRRQAGAMTRLCAGLPREAPEAGAPEPAALLRAARANLSRTNVLAGLDVALDGFAAYLAATLGWPSPPLTVSAAMPPAPVAALGAGALDALRAGLELDLRLYEGARDWLDVLAG